MAGGRTLTVYLAADTKGAQGALSNFGSTLANIGKVAGIAAVAGLAVLAKKMADIAVEAVDLAADFEETTNKAQVLFGKKAVKDVEAWAAAAAKALGQSKIQATNAASTFAVFGKAAGLTGKDLSGFSIELGTLASDLASFNNTDVDTAITAIGAALRGESEPIRQFGVLLDDATLKARAMEMGLISTTDNALTPQQKVLAAHAEILAQTSDAQGDFARTSDSATNQQKILAAEVENLKIRLGEVLLPLKEKALKFLVEEFIPLLQDMANKFLPKVEAALRALSDWWNTEGQKAFNSIVDWWDENGTRVFTDLRDIAREIGSAYEDVARTFGKFRDVLGTGGDAGSTTGSIVNFLIQAGKILAWAQSFSIRLVISQFERLADVMLAIKEVMKYIIDNIGKVQNPLQTISEVGGAINNVIGRSSMGAKSSSSSTTINIQTGVGDPVAIGREIDRILRLRDLRVGVA